jgi:NADH-quinone oxidoreductase subunit G
MGSVGACRQCAVKQYRNAEDRTGTVVMACMTPASDGAIVSIADPQAVSFRAHVIESLMISHPHDCPVCEEGGECHLQDMTQMSATTTGAMTSGKSRIAIRIWAPSSSTK